MKFVKFVAGLLLCIFVFQPEVSAQTTFILFRHAEKDTSMAGSGQMDANPPLSDVGLKRAQKLVKALEEYKPDQLFTTDFTRTRQTIQPLAETFKLPVKTYDHKQLRAFADSLLTLKNQVIFIAGHSNSTPALANMLNKRDVFKQFAETEYGTILLVMVPAQGRPDSEVIEY